MTLDLAAIEERAKDCLDYPDVCERNTCGAPNISEMAREILALVEEVRLLRTVAETANRAVILEYDPGRGPSENIEIARRAEALRDALAGLSREPAGEENE